MGASATMRSRGKPTSALTAWYRARFADNGVDFR
jgi:hypothetical protein